MNTIRVLTWAKADESARLQVEESLSPNKRVCIGGFAPVETGFGLRLHVPLSEAQMDDETRDPGSFMELTYEQAMDLNAKLTTLLAELDAKR